MHHKAIAAGDRPAATVRGLGVCDALEVDIAPVQLEWLIDELDETRGPLEEQLARERESGDARAVDDAAYELFLLRSMRARLPAAPVGERVRFVGPSGMVMSVVRGAARNVIAALGELAAARELDAQGRARLRSTAAAAAAWVETLVDCEAVVAFTFDPDASPMRPW